MSNELHSTSINQNLINNYFNRQESIIDYESSDEDDEAASQSGAEDQQQSSNNQTDNNNNNNGMIQDTKYSTMWLGNSDGK